MTEFQEKTERIQVPTNTGVQGFLRVLEAILKLGRVQRVNINATGVVEYMRYVAEGEDQPQGVQVSLEGLSPRELIIAGQVTEVPSGLLPHQDVMKAFAAVRMAAMAPVAWVVGEGTVLRQWFQASGVELLDLEEFMGLPVHRAADVADSALILCASHSRQGVFTDCTKFYKVAMAAPVDRQLEAPPTEVEVLYE